MLKSLVTIVIVAVAVAGCSSGEPTPTPAKPEAPAAAKPAAPPAAAPAGAPAAGGAAVRIDGSSNEALSKSIAKMWESMDKAQRDEVARATAIILADIQKRDGGDEEKSKALWIEAINGKTAAEIIAYGDSLQKGAGTTGGTAAGK